MAEGVASINSALYLEDVEVLLEALRNDHVGLEEVDYSNVPHYSALLHATLTTKAEVFHHLISYMRLPL